MSFKCSVGARLSCGFLSGEAGAMGATGSRAMTALSLQLDGARATMSRR